MPAAAARASWPWRAGGGRSRHGKSGFLSVTVTGPGRRIRSGPAVAPGDRRYGWAGAVLGPTPTSTVTQPTLPFGPLAAIR